MVRNISCDFFILLYICKSSRKCQLRTAPHACFKKLSFTEFCDILLILIEIFKLKLIFSAFMRLFCNMFYNRFSYNNTETTLINSTTGYILNVNAQRNFFSTYMYCLIKNMLTIYLLVFGYHSDPIGMSLALYCQQILMDFITLFVF